MNLAPGDRVDRFLLRERIGVGGQAEVWRVEDSLSPGSTSAIKLLHDSAEAERVRREAFELTRLRHPSVVRGHGIFENHQSRVGVVMELVEGRTLLGLVGDPRLDERAKFFVLLHVANALAHVHAHGVVHRDVKLENVLVTDAFFRTPHDPATVKLIDFGIAVRSRNPHPLTRAGFVMGTTPYLAPEQVDPRHFGGWRDTPESDVFAFGILAWRVLGDDALQHPTGLRNIASLDEFAIAYRRAEHDRWPIGIRHPAYRALLRKTLALRPEARIRNGAELVRELGRVGTLDDTTSGSLTLASEPATLVYQREPPTEVQSRPRKRWPYVLVAAALVASAAFAAIASFEPEEDFVPPLPAHVGRGPV
jgi:eukaryotic-like serine/threonine-protein kinase